MERSKDISSREKRTNIIFIIISGILFLVSTILVIILPIYNLVYTTGVVVFVFSIVFAIFGFFGLIFSIIAFVVSFCNIEINTPEIPITVEAIDDRRNEYSEKSNAANTEMEVNWDKLYPLIYQGTITNKICPICKLQIKKKDFVMQCPKYLKLFHGKHLVDWLIKHSKCPVCQTIIEIR